MSALTVTTLPPHADLCEAIRSFLEQVSFRPGEISQMPGKAEIAAMAAHLGLMLRWNQRENLTAIRDLGQAIARHVGESCEGLTLLPHDAQGLVVDLGSGNGFPALPLLAARPGMQARLLEKSEKKADFIHAAIRAISKKIQDFDQRVTVEHRHFGGAGHLPAETRWVMMRGFPAPLATLRSLLQVRPRLGLILWLGSSDLERLADELDVPPSRLDRRPLRSSDAGGILHLAPDDQRP